MRPQIIKTGIVTAAMIDGQSVFLFEVQKTEVEAADHARIDQLIGELRKAAKRGRASIGLSFAYDDDPRELFEIPEVAAYVKHIFAECPHIVYYLLPDQGAIRTWLFCLAGARIKNKNTVLARMDVDQKRFAELCAAVAAATQAYGDAVGDSAGARRHLAEIGF